MVRQSVDSLLGTVLLGALLPYVLLSEFRDFVKSAPTRSIRECAPARVSTGAAVAAIGEFDFDRAIEAYEDLLDEMIGEASQ